MENSTPKAPSPSQRAEVPKLLAHSEANYIPYVRSIRHMEYYDLNPLLTDAVILQVYFNIFTISSYLLNPLAV
jgi:hypothetical protein